MHNVGLLFLWCIGWQMDSSLIQHMAQLYIDPMEYAAAQGYYTPAAHEVNDHFDWNEAESSESAIEALDPPACPDSGDAPAESKTSAQ